LNWRKHVSHHLPVHQLTPVVAPSVPGALTTPNRCSSHARRGLTGKVGVQCASIRRSCRGPTNRPDRGLVSFKYRPD
jgi:hypothetical protein